jgi:hypothetical protein
MALVVTVIRGSSEGRHHHWLRGDRQAGFDGLSADFIAGRNKP